MFPLITLEEHFLEPSIGLIHEDDKIHYNNYPKTLISRLEDLGEDRIKDLDKNQISIQVLSHSPISDPSPSACRYGNDLLAAKIIHHPSRYAGFALLPMSQPNEAAKELKYCIESLGFVGALIPNHTVDSTFYDSESYAPFWATAESLQKPIYIHPTFPSAAQKPQFQGNFGPDVTEALGCWAWGWHASTALHFLRLFASGLFDRYPGLRIILGHMGEMLPYQLSRIIPITRSWKPAKKRNLRQVWDENVWVTTSGMFGLAPLACLLQEVHRDRILFSIDYPFSGNEDGRRFIEQVRQSGMLRDEEEVKDFAFRNAERLLGVKAVGA